MGRESQGRPEFGGRISNILVIALNANAVGIPVKRQRPSDCIKMLFDTLTAQN